MSSKQWQVPYPSSAHFIYHILIFAITGYLPHTLSYTTSTSYITSTSYTTYSASHSITTYSSTCAHITIIKQTREWSSRWSKDNPHNPIKRLLQSYVMAIDSTIAISIQVLKHNASCNMVLHAVHLVYITCIPYLGKRWLSTLTWSVILNPYTQAKQARNQTWRSPIITIKWEA